MKNTATAALARSYRGERVLTVLIGLVALLAGAGAILLGLGWLGTFRATLPVLDPVVLDWLGDRGQWSRIGAIAAGVLLFVVGVAFALRSLRPEPHPNLALDETQGRALTVRSGALAEAVTADVEGIDGVSRARATVVGDQRRPALRLSLWLRAGSDVRTVWQELDGVLTRTKECLGVESLPAAVRVELAAAKRQRVR